jgi:hypothetical protein
VSQWPTDIDGSRGVAIGLPEAPGLDEIIRDYMEDFGYRP